MFFQNVIAIVLIVLVHIQLSEELWLSEMFSPEGWQFGDGMVFHLEDTKVKNYSIFDRIGMKVDYGNVRINAVQKPEKEAVELDFYVMDKEDGRSKKMGNMMIPFLLGATKASVMTAVLGTLKMMAVKSLMVAKVALMLSMLVLVGKFFKHQQEPANYIEVDNPGAYAQYSPHEYEGYGDAGSYSANLNTYIPYNGYSLSAAGSSLNYATLAIPANDSVPLMQVVPSTKRRDQGRRKTPSTVLTIRRYSQSESGLI